MAGDWLKVEKMTPDKPEIAILARRLGVSQGDAFLSWFRVYSWADGVTTNGYVPNLTIPDAETLSRCCHSTCAILASPEIGWLKEKCEEKDGIKTVGIQFANWSRHNGTSAKKRVKDAERQRKHRQKPSRKCHNKSVTREEKRREDIKETPLPLSLDCECFRLAWADWLAYKAERGKAYKPRGVKACLSRLAQMGAAKASAAIHYSMAQDWDGIFEEKAGPQQKSLLEHSGPILRDPIS